MSEDCPHCVFEKTEANCRGCFEGSHYKPKPITNADRIRSMSDEELAVMLAWPYIASPPWCAEHTTCPYIGEDPTPCNKCALGWLKQEATDDP